MKLLSRLPTMETWVTSLVLAFLWHDVTAFLCDYAGDVTVQRDTYLQAPVLSSFSGLGLSVCERKCLNVTGSFTFNYFRPDGKCECLGETNASSAHALVSWKGWHHGVVATLSQQQLTADPTMFVSLAWVSSQYRGSGLTCGSFASSFTLKGLGVPSDSSVLMTSHWSQGILAVVPGTNCTCADGKSCVLDMPALIRCPMACPPPPPLSGSTAHVTAVSPTAAASYTCLEDFTFFGSSSHVTCTAEGTWEGLNGTCKQTSWTNPTQIVFAIPEPVEAYWRVETVFELTTVVATAINLMDGSDIRLSLGMRIDYFGQNYTVFNSRYAGALQTEVHVNNAPWGTGLVFNVTIVLNCPAFGFQVFVNGTLHGVYNNGKPCTPLDKVTVATGTQVYRLRMVYP